MHFFKRKKAKNIYSFNYFSVAFKSYKEHYFCCIFLLQCDVIWKKQLSYISPAKCTSDVMKNPTNSNF